MPLTFAPSSLTTADLDVTATDGSVVTVATAAGFKVTSSSKWGVSGTRPYYNSAGVTAGDDATYIAESRPLLRT